MSSMGLQFLYPLLNMAGLVVHVIVAVAVWRLVRAHESVSMTPMEAVEELRKENRAE